MHQDYPESLLNMDCWSPIPEFIVQKVWSEAKEYMFLKKFPGAATAAVLGILL